MTPIRFRIFAETELLRIGEWYDGERDGLGSRFRTAFEDSIERIRRQPLMYASGFRGVRKAPVDGFPYFIVYRFDAERIDVIAVVHVRRKASVWTRRL
jgi:toxin ParE1/3/4